MGVKEKQPAYGMVNCILTRPDCEFGEMKSMVEIATLGLARFVYKLIHSLRED